MFSLHTSFSASLALIAALRAGCGAPPLRPAKGTSPFGIPVPRFARGF